MKRFFIIWFAFGIFIYGGISFYHLNINPVKWSADARAGFVLSWMVCILLSAFIADVTKGNKEKEDVEIKTIAGHFLDILNRDK